MNIGIITIGALGGYVWRLYREYRNGPLPRYMHSTVEA